MAEDGRWGNLPPNRLSFGMGNRGGNMANEQRLKREMRWQVIQLNMETIASLGKFYVKIVIVNQPDSWLPSLNMIEFQDMPQF